MLIRSLCQKCFAGFARVRTHKPPLNQISLAALVETCKEVPKVPVLHSQTLLCSIELCFIFQGCRRQVKWSLSLSKGYKEILFSYTSMKTNWNVTDGKKKKKKCKLQVVRKRQRSGSTLSFPISAYSSFCLTFMWIVLLKWQIYYSLQSVFWHIHKLLVQRESETKHGHFSWGNCSALSFRRQVVLKAKE